MEKQKRKLLIIGGIVALSLIAGIVALTGKQTQQFKGMFFAPRMGEESPKRPSPDMTEGEGVLSPDIQPKEEEKMMVEKIPETKPALLLVDDVIPVEQEQPMAAEKVETKPPLGPIDDTLPLEKIVVERVALEDFGKRPPCEDIATVEYCTSRQDCMWTPKFRVDKELIGGTCTTKPPPPPPTPQPQPQPELQKEEELQQPRPPIEKENIHPNKPILKLPPDATTISTATPTLTWEDGGDPDNTKPGVHFYRYYIKDKEINTIIWSRDWFTPNEDPNECITENKRWICTKVKIPEGVLKDGKNYAWSVEENDGNDGSGYATEFSFRTKLESRRAKAKDKRSKPDIPGPEPVPPAPPPPPPAPSPAPAPAPAAPVAPSLTVKTADVTSSISRTAGDTVQFTAAKILFKTTGKATVKIITISEYVDEAAGQNMTSTIETIALFVDHGNGETLLGKETTLAEDGTATFENLNWTLTNTEEKLIIKTRLKKNAAAGAKLAVGIDTPIDIILEGTNDPKGSFPLIGNEIVLTKTAITVQAPPASKQSSSPPPTPAPSSKTSSTAAPGTTTTSKTEAATTFSPPAASSSTSSGTVTQRNAAKSASSSSSPSSSSSSASVSPLSSPVIRVIENQHPGAYAPTDSEEIKTDAAKPVETGATEQAASSSVRVSDTVLSQMPEQAKTGPGLLIYISVLAAVHGGLFLKRKFKNK